ncbi:hypothetical protein [Paenibacillus kandeliae]|uniref:hypothetical protein n=1 Tax=Paenibacillus kandeliae TaxID=3231269 RepID=UPI00345B2B5D
MKKIMSFLTVGVCAILVSTNVSAQSVSLDTYNNSLKNGGPIVSGGGIGTTAIAKYGGAGKFYDASTKSTSKKENFSFKIEHTKGVSTSVSRAVALEAFTELSVGGETELQIIGQAVTASAEVKAGVKSSVTTTVSWTVDAAQPSGNYLASTGKETMKTSGYIETANTGGVVTSSKYILAYYTTRPYSSVKKV